MDKVNITPWPQGHKVTKVVSVFWLILCIFANSSYSSHRRGMAMHRNVPCGHTKKPNAAEFWIFTLKVRYCPYKVKHQNRHLTALMTSDHDYIHMVGRYGQDQHTHVTSRSQGQSQGHQSCFRFPVFCVFFANSSLIKLVLEAIWNSLEASILWWSQGQGHQSKLHQYQGQICCRSTILLHGRRSHIPRYACFSIKVHLYDFIGIVGLHKRIIENSCIIWIVFVLLACCKHLPQF